MVAPILLFALGFVPGLIMSAVTSPWWVRAVVYAVLLSPIAALILLLYFEAVDSDTVSALRAPATGH